MKRHNSILGIFMLVFYIASPFLDSMVCDDCLGKDPFLGRLAGSHTHAPWTDDTLSLHKADTPHQTPDREESGSCCTLCFNAAMGVSIYRHAPEFLVSVFESQTTFVVPSEPSFSIKKPPQRSLSS